jgi:hypothetical protein
MGEQHEKSEGGLTPLLLQIRVRIIYERQMSAKGKANICGRRADHKHRRTN